MREINLNELYNYSWQNILDSEQFTVMCFFIFCVCILEVMLGTLT